MGLGKRARLACQGRDGGPGWGFVGSGCCMVALVGMLTLSRNMVAMSRWTGVGGGIYTRRVKNETVELGCYAILYAPAVMRCGTVVSGSVSRSGFTISRCLVCFHLSGFAFRCSAFLLAPRPSIDMWLGAARHRMATVSCGTTFFAGASDQYCYQLCWISRANFRFVVY